jgi:hypothetical protein
MILISYLSGSQFQCAFYAIHSVVTALNSLLTHYGHYAGDHTHSYTSYMVFLLSLAASHASLKGMYPFLPSLLFFIHCFWRFYLSNKFWSLLPLSLLFRSSLVVVICHLGFGALLISETSPLPCLQQRGRRVGRQPEAETGRYLPHIQSLRSSRAPPSCLFGYRSE